MKLINQHHHTGSYSDHSFVETVYFFEELNVVLTVTKYDSGVTNLNAVGGTIEQQDAAKRRYREFERKNIKGK
jgi:hypothetical protein